MVHMWVSRIDWVDNFTVLGKYIHTAKKRYCWAHEGYFHPHNRKWAIPNPQVGSGRGTGWPYFVKSPLAALWRPRDGSVWGLFRAREVTPAIWQCLGAVSCPRDDRPWGGTVCGCCFVQACEMTDPEVAACGINSVYLVWLLIPWQLTGSSIDWTDRITSNKWSSVVRLCVYICSFCYYCALLSCVQMIKYIGALWSYSCE